MTPDPGSLLPVALQAAEIATGLMQSRRPASLTEKHDRDLVSDVDLAIEAANAATLPTWKPGDEFLAAREKSR